MFYLLLVIGLGFFCCWHLLVQICNLAIKIGPAHVSILSPFHSSSLLVPPSCSKVWQVLQQKMQATHVAKTIELDITQFAEVSSGGW
jgi:hypothetical protein